MVNIITNLMNANAFETAALVVSIMIVVEYISRIIVLIHKAITVKTDSKGIKQLKFQEYNNTWNKYCVRSK